MSIDLDASTANVPDADGRRPLHHAALAGDTDLLERILALGAMVAAVDESGWSALHSAAKGEREALVAEADAKQGQPGVVRRCAHAEVAWDVGAPWAG